VPLYDLVSNWAYMVIAALAWNILCRAQHKMFHAACRVMPRGPLGPLAPGVLPRFDAA